jgi:hypothetical protein
MSRGLPRSGCPSGRNQKSMMSRMDGACVMRLS